MLKICDDENHSGILTIKNFGNRRTKSVMLSENAQQRRQILAYMHTANTNIQGQVKQIN